MVWFGVVWCGVALYGEVKCSCKVWCGVVWCGVVRSLDCCSLVRLD